MKTLLFSPRAEVDLDDIWEFTVKTWGQIQAVHYTAQIQRACEDICSGKAKFRPADIRQGYFKYRTGSHMIYFTQTDRDIIVMRILHQSMDVERHL